MHSEPMINWEQLIEAAQDAAKNSYSPYSEYKVGAAAFTDNGRLVTGCNIENASYGLTLCAECSLVSELYRTGGGKLFAFVCVNGEGNIIMPCGRCRQLLQEHAADGFKIRTPHTIKTIEDILPDAFNRGDLS